MYKIDFTRIEVQPDLSSTEKKTINLAKELGNAIYMEAKDLESDTLARKIYDSDGEVNLTEKEKTFITETYLARLPYFIRTACVFEPDKK